ncbi:MAG: hypothetical protein KDD62_08880, partial [Bdellovibrionales bacterium]|nr:hypothetical protein [Bdellovibrionales bacterium]
MPPVTDDRRSDSPDTDTTPAPSEQVDWLHGSVGADEPVYSHFERTDAVFREAINPYPGLAEPEAGYRPGQYIMSALKDKAEFEQSISNTPGRSIEVRVEELHNLISEAESGTAYKSAFDFKAKLTEVFAGLNDNQA